MRDDDEILPFLVYRIIGEQMECALWMLEDGGKALAVFLTETSAGDYIRSTSLGSEWKVFRPVRSDLMQILKRSRAANIHHAVLDPDDRQAKRIFDIDQILNEEDDRAG